MIAMTPVQRAVLHALYLASNEWAAQKLIIALLKQEKTPVSLLALIEHAAVAKAVRNE